MGFPTLSGAFARLRGSLPAGVEITFPRFDQLQICDCCGIEVCPEFDDPFLRADHPYWERKPPYEVVDGLYSWNPPPPGAKLDLPTRAIPYQLRSWDEKIYYHLIRAGKQITEVLRSRTDRLCELVSLQESGLLEDAVGLFQWWRNP